MKRVFSLDERLQTVYDIYPKCKLAADIGSDHGKLPCKLLMNSVCEKIIVNDISELCLIKAKKLIDSHSLSDRAIFRVANGLEAINENVDCISITGMGGFAISDIISNINKLNNRPSLILSAHTDLYELRKTLFKINYCIEFEKIVFCKGRFYSIIFAKSDDIKMSEKDILIGRNISANSNKILLDYLYWLKKVEMVKINKNMLLLGYLEEEISNANTDY